MISTKDTAERDALLKALQLAEKEISQARTALQRAESNFREASLELNAERSKVAALKGDNHPALAEAKATEHRAAAQIQQLEAQLRGQQAQFEALERAAEEFRRENEELRSQMDAKESELRSLQRETDKAEAELRRLRALLLKVTTGSEEPMPTLRQSKTSCRGKDNPLETSAHPEPAMSYGSEATYQRSR
jgi:chromosome segregation ATPase